MFFERFASEGIQKRPSHEGVFRPTGVRGFLGPIRPYLTALLLVFKPTYRVRGYFVQPPVRPSPDSDTPPADDELVAFDKQKCGCWASCLQRVTPRFFSWAAGCVMGVMLEGFGFGAFRGEKVVLEWLFFPSSCATFCAKTWPHIRGQNGASDL